MVKLLADEQTNTTNKNQKLKAILNYCFRIFIFLILNRSFIYGIIAMPINAIFLPLSRIEFSVDPIDFFIIAVLLQDYAMAKICGLFKKLDNLNIFLSLIIIVLIDIIRSYSWMICVQIVPSFKMAFYKNDVVVLLFIQFLLYRFFYFLTKKFPIPFEKIREYTSIEFYINIAKKLLKKKAK